MADQILKNILQTDLPGVCLIKRPEFPDDRGFFKETYRQNELEEVTGLRFNPVQQNHSRSSKGVLRGIHVAPWTKMVYVVSGLVQQVVVDFRKDSPTFGRYFSIKLGEENHSAILIPPFCGNAFLVLSETADYTYLVNDYWSPGKEIGVAWNLPELNIKWENSSPVLSEKDLHNLVTLPKLPE